MMTEFCGTLMYKAVYSRFQWTDVVHVGQIINLLYKILSEHKKNKPLSKAATVICNPC